MKTDRNQSQDQVPNSPIDHPFLKTQLAYDHTLEVAPPYTRALWKMQHRWIRADVARFKSGSKIRVLDVGCGPAHMYESLREHIDLYLGIDTSLIELRRAAPSPSRLLVNGVGEHLEYLPDNSYDLVLFVSVLDHVIDWKRTIDRCSQVLRPGGLMLILMENEEQLVNRLRKLLGRPIDHADHMAYFTLGDLATQLGSGFVALKARTYGYGFGLHKLTTRIPVPQAVFDVLLPIIDLVGHTLMPNSGQVLYGLYQKKADTIVQSSSDYLVCPSCAAPLQWGEPACKNCHFETTYRENILDAMSFLTRGLKSSN